MKTLHFSTIVLTLACGCSDESVAREATMAAATAGSPEGESSPSPAAIALEVSPSPGPPMPGASTGEMVGVVLDFDTARPLKGVSMLCMKGTPADGKTTQETRQDGVFRWTLQDSSRVEIHFAYTGYSVISPTPIQALPDVAGWDLPAELPQNVEMFRTDVSLLLDDSSASYASKLATTLVARAQQGGPGKRDLSEAWLSITRSPLPVFVRVLTAQRIARADLPAEMVPKGCSVYAEVDPAAALRWDLAVRTADRGEFRLPTLRAAEVTRLPEVVVADALEAAVRARKGREGTLGLASLQQWYQAERLSFPPSLEGIDKLKSPQLLR